MQISGPSIECFKCQMYCNRPQILVCTIHPTGPLDESCPDFAQLGIESGGYEDWEPETISYYTGQPVPDFGRVLTTEQKWGLIDTHPLFTGVCPCCGAEFKRIPPPPVHWDCENCGWTDDSL